MDPRPDVAPPEDIVFVDGVRRVDAELVVFDGPLRGRTYLDGVGFIKTQLIEDGPQ